MPIPRRKVSSGNTFELRIDKEEVKPRPQNTSSGKEEHRRSVTQTYKKETTQDKPLRSYLYLGLQLIRAESTSWTRRQSIPTLSTSQVKLVIQVEAKTGVAEAPDDTIHTSRPPQVLVRQSGETLRRDPRR